MAVGLAYGSPARAQIIIDHTCIDLARIHAYNIDRAKASVFIAYGHGLYGSQIVSGMVAIVDQYGNRYGFDYYGTDDNLSLQDYTPAGDLGDPDLTTWAARTRTMLNQSGNDRNVVIWAWESQLSTATEADVTAYLTLMTQLEEEFPRVSFVYMTGHLDGTGSEGNLHQRNEQIRAWCRDQGKVLYDFADIEAHDPDGTDYLDQHADDACNYDGGNWADQWCEANPGLCPSFDCALTHRLSGYMKAEAFWWLVARLGGWDPDYSAAADWALYR